MALSENISVRKFSTIRVQYMSHLLLAGMKQCRKVSHRCITFSHINSLLHVLPSFAGIPLTVHNVGLAFGLTLVSDKTDALLSIAC